MHVTRQGRSEISILLRVAAIGLTLTAAQRVGALNVTVELFTTVPGSAIDIVNAGDSRLFIAEQEGVIRVAQSDGTVLGTPFMDISDRLISGGERGLLGLAFDPQYGSNGRFYVYYTRDPNPMMSGEVGEGDLVISRFNVTGDPNIADPSSEVPLLTITHTLGNHNGGNLMFGPDGYLYIGTGDGGGGGDPFENGQNGLALLGKMLRIDVHSGSPYGIPPSNPFVGSAPLDEIWALGMRNPFRFSFDRLTGDLWIGDVGQDTWEEVDFQPASSSGGENWGWDCYEGNHSFEPAGCGPMSGYDFPVHEYQHTDGNCTVIGGYVYRGSQYPLLYGHYLLADYCSGNMWTLSPAGGGNYSLTPLGDLLPGFATSSFGQDINGELYITELNGTIYHIVENTPPATFTCPTTPFPSCRQPVDSGKALLFLKKNNDTTKNKLIWKWLKGDTTTAGDLGDPTSSTNYALCMYSGSSLIMEADIPAGGTCGGDPCWQTAGSNGFNYKSKPAVSGGVEKVLVKSGAAGKAKALVKGKGSGLIMPSLPLTQPLRVQLLTDGNACAEALYSGTPIHNDANQFKAKAD